MTWARYRKDKKEPNEEKSKLRPSWKKLDNPESRSVSWGESRLLYSPPLGAISCLSWNRKHSSNGVALGILSSLHDNR
ncbi:hypothetical protein PoB_005045200 [Plakobranchus ocellatus]|uniref:Uncharacterized protein n=1 Tax=Plakobranchus ocellatus TaxID=259542 RepID=A0AAV4BXT1_9GAST|nr:hypothetical protein PoB_005045200 [Plakobranchus ocellatus]